MTASLFDWLLDGVRATGGRSPLPEVRQWGEYGAETTRTDPFALDRLALMHATRDDNADGPPGGWPLDDVSASEPRVVRIDRRRA